jgi:hypothetical protein
MLGWAQVFFLLKIRIVHKPRIGAHSGAAENKPIVPSPIHPYGLEKEFPNQ